jgi:hypothetical protein
MRHERTPELERDGDLEIGLDLDRKAVVHLG